MPPKKTLTLGGTGAAKFSKAKGAALPSAGANVLSGKSKKATSLGGFAALTGSITKSPEFDQKTSSANMTATKYALERKERFEATGEFTYKSADTIMKEKSTGCGRMRHSCVCVRLRKLCCREKAFYPNTFRDTATPCAGVAKKSVRFGCVQVNSKFGRDMEWALRFGIGAFLACLPSLLVSTSESLITAASVTPADYGFVQWKNFTCGGSTFQENKLAGCAGDGKVYQINWTQGYFSKNAHEPNGMEWVDPSGLRTGVAWWDQMNANGYESHGILVTPGHNETGQWVDFGGLKRGHYATLTTEKRNASNPLHPKMPETVMCRDEKLSSFMHPAFYGDKGTCGRSRSGECGWTKNNVWKSIAQRECPYTCDVEGCGVTDSFDDFATAWDPAFAVVVFIICFGYSFGETHRYCWEFVAGMIPSMILPSIVVNNFGVSVFGMLFSMGLYTFIFAAFPIDGSIKKISIAPAMMYFATQLNYSQNGHFLTTQTVMYRVFRHGCYGVVVALAMQIVPYPRFAMPNVMRRLNTVVSNMILATSFGFRQCNEGTSALERTKLRKMLDDLQLEMQLLEEDVGFARWEPGNATKISQLKIFMATLHKVQANLRGIQQTTSMEYADTTDRMRKCMSTVCASICETLEGTADFVMHSTKDVTELDSNTVSANWLIASRVYVRERLECKVEEDIKGYKKLVRQQKLFTTVYNDMRRLAREADETLDKNKFRNCFLCNANSMSWALVMFPAEYAASLEARNAESSSSSDFIPESNEVTLQFQKRDLISAIKMAIAVTLSMGLNVQYFKSDALAPVLIAYTMAGHQGPSYSMTSQRVMGFMLGMILSQCVISAAEVDDTCNPHVLGALIGVVMILLGYIRASSFGHAYDAVIASILVSIICLTRCTASKVDQFKTIEQVVLGSLVVAAAEYVLYPVFPASAGEDTRRLLRRALVETHTAFKIIFEGHLTEAWEEMERKAQVARAYAEGRVEEFTKAKRQTRVVDNSLWRNLYVHANALDGCLAQWGEEPTMVGITLGGYDDMLMLYRKFSDTLCVFQNHVARLERQRNEKGRMLIDDCKKEMKKVHVDINSCFEELEMIFFMNRVQDANAVAIVADSDSSSGNAGGGGNFTRMHDSMEALNVAWMKNLDDRMLNEHLDDGDNVEANFEGKGRWLKGKIRSVQLDKGTRTFTVAFDTGDVEKGVGLDAIRDAVMHSDDVFGYHSVRNLMERMVNLLMEMERLVKSGKRSHDKAAW